MAQEGGRPTRQRPEESVYGALRHPGQAHGAQVRLCDGVRSGLLGVDGTEPHAGSERSVCVSVCVYMSAQLCMCVYVCKIYVYQYVINIIHICIYDT